MPSSKPVPIIGPSSKDRCQAEESLSAGAVRAQPRPCRQCSGLPLGIASRVEDGEGRLSRVKDPVFAMAESFFLDGGGRLDHVELQSLTTISEWRSVAPLDAISPDVGRCRT